MSGGKITIRAGGKITKTCNEYSIYTNNLTLSSNGTISLTCDGMMTFGEPEPCPPQELRAKSIVHFRPHKDWKGEDFGFDWMRIADTNFAGDRPSGKYESILERKSFEALKNEYGNPYYKVLNKTNETGEQEEYFVPWLSLFPSQIQDENTEEWKESNYSNTKANLVLNIDTIEEPKEFALSYNDELFNISHVILPLKKGMHKDINFFIEALKPFSTIEEIKIYAIDKYGKQLAGMLRVLPNHIIYKPNIVLVDVTTELADRKTGTPANNPEEILQKFLRQALIEAEFKYADLNAASQDKFEQLDAGMVSRKRYFNSRHHVGENMIRVNDEKYQAELLHGDLVGFLIKDYPNKYLNYFKVFYINEDPNIKELVGLSSSLEDARSVLIFPDGFSNETVAHEVLHSMGLRHSFDKDNKYTFAQYTTDNIMDYELTKAPIEGMKFNQIPSIQLWKWQMDILRSNFKTNTFKLTGK